MFRYKNLDNLLNESENARKYFSCLPDRVKTSLIKKGSRIFTEDDLINYSENIIHDFV